MTGPAVLLDETTAPSYLVARGVLAADEVTTAIAERLAGGVSSRVLRVQGRSSCVVVKQAMEKLQVEDDWFVDTRRSQYEARALEVLHRLTPDCVPQLIDVDVDESAITIEAAGAGWRTWKAHLLEGDIREHVPAALGAMLATWHSNTPRESLPPELRTLNLFRELRIEPYFSSAGGRAPELRDALDRVGLRLVTDGRSLVLGDFSPKNVLVADSGPGVWAIDHEVAHFGDPTFDVAFMTSHLALKIVHLPEMRDGLSNAVAGFLLAYGDAPGAQDQQHLARTVGALMAARVLGSSPVEYLTVEEKADVLARARILLLAPDVADEWKKVITE